PTPLPVQSVGHRCARPGRSVSIAGCGASAIEGTARASEVCRTDPTDDDDEPTYAAQKVSEREGKTYLISDRGSYDRCAALSWSLAAADGATGVEAPTHVLMFHNGEFVALGLPCALPVSAIDSPDPRTVIASYRSTDAPESEMRYQWNDSLETIDRVGPQPLC
uniref:LppP/LprE family lipoprotein n=1 Tax=Rhodococcus sp. BS-15 TaxID=1304954 RepID=UPI00165191F7